MGKHATLKNKAFSILVCCKMLYLDKCEIVPLLFLKYKLRTESLSETEMHRFCLRSLLLHAMSLFMISTRRQLATFCNGLSTCVYWCTRSPGHLHIVLRSLLERDFSPSRGCKQGIVLINDSSLWNTLME